MEVASFGDIEQEFLSRIASVVWCNVASVDGKGRPRSRILHPIWEIVEGKPVGWIGTRRNSYKGSHLERNPFVSLAYVRDTNKPVYVDCRAEWADDLQEKERVWKLFVSTPPSLGYDPAPVFVNYDHENYGVLKLIPWRVEVTDAEVIPPVKNVWHAG